MAQSEWHVKMNGKLQGPYTEDELRSLIQSGKIRGDTMLWNGDGGWMQGSASPFAQEIMNAPESPPAATRIPHQRTGSASEGKPFLGAPLEWYMEDPFGRMIGLNCLQAVFLIILGLVFSSGAIATSLSLISSIALLVANYFLASADIRRLKEEGRETPKLWGAVFFPPFYFYSRYRKLREKGTPLLLYLICIALWIYAEIFPPFGMDTQIAATARPLVTKILSNLTTNSASCTEVKIDRKVSDGLYNATAYLSNGNNVKIIIQREGDMVYVKLANPFGF